MILLRHIYIYISIYTHIHITTLIYTHVQRNNITLDSNVLVGDGALVEVDDACELTASIILLLLLLLLLLLVLLLRTTTTTTTTILLLLLLLIIRRKQTDNEHETDDLVNTQSGLLNCLFEQQPIY